MDSLGKLAKLSTLFPAEFHPRRDILRPFAAVTIALESANLKLYAAELDEEGLKTVFRDTTANSSSVGGVPCTVKIACLARSLLPGDESERFYVSRPVFEQVLEDIGFSPWVEHLIVSHAYGFHYRDTPTGLATGNSAASYYLGTNCVSFAWATRRQSSGVFLTKCLIIQPIDNPESKGADLLEGIADYLNALEAFKKDSHSALFLPIALATANLRACEFYCLKRTRTVRWIEERTGHGDARGSEHTGLHFEWQRNDIPRYTAQLGHALTSMGRISMYFDTLKSIFDYIESHPNHAVGESLDVPEAVTTSDDRILQVVQVLRQQVEAARLRKNYVDLRIRNQMSVLFAFLTHEDAKVNIRVANASREVAETARRDGSSMKTIAVLTMVFLPATFLSALFSMPSLGWDGPEKFKLYWACAIPLTVVTFILWAGITQREQISELISGFNRASAKNNSGFNAKEKELS